MSKLGATRRAISSCLAVIGFFASVGATAEYYVGPGGRPDNPGTKARPWDIASVLGGKQKISPGDTIYLLEGVYRRRPKERYEIRLVGTAKKPIHVRPVPGARATIDGGLGMMSPSAHVWLWDLEITVSEPTPSEPVAPGSHPEDFKRPWGGMNMYGGRNCKYINLVIHDNRQGISCWKGEINPEIYGCLIYDNGWLGTDRGHGHCIYTQNETGTKTVSNCIMTCRYGGTYTMHAYGSKRAFVDNFLIMENVCYGRGPFLVGGGRPSRNIRVLWNYLHNVNMRIGYNAPHNENCEVRDNVILNGRLTINGYRKVVREGNLVVGRDAKRPADEKARTVWLPNRYDPNRAHLVIYDRRKRSAVAVAAAPFLKPGDTYRLMDPQNVFGGPVAAGRCGGDGISVRMNGEFAVFVVLKGKGPPSRGVAAPRGDPSGR